MTDEDAGEAARPGWLADRIAGRERHRDRCACVCGGLKIARENGAGRQRHQDRCCKKAARQQPPLAEIDALIFGVLSGIVFVGRIGHGFSVLASGDTATRIITKLAWTNVTNATFRPLQRGDDRRVNVCRRAGIHHVRSKVK